MVILQIAFWIASKFESKLLAAASMTFKKHMTKSVRKGFLKGNPKLSKKD